MKPRRYHGLKRPKLRQSWNKYNLFNIWRMRDPKLGKGDQETFFQQKWKAKGMLRNYHGEHVVERKWTRMFSRRLLSVADMDPKYMAKYDGSELAAGRGSGKDTPPNWSKEEVEKPIPTPYMQMTFAPMERRLDIAVFRAMFASSARQARQFCVHGAVRVNGKVMPYPAYRLNPGDMFQVDPERVLYATGMPKPDPNKSKRKKASTDGAEGESEEPVEEEAEAEAEEEVQAAAEGEVTEAKEAEAVEQDPETTDAPEPAKVDMKPTQKQIREIVQQAKTLLDEEGDLGAHQKQRLRKFIKDLRPLTSRASRPDASPKEIASELSDLVSGLNLSSSSSEDAPAVKEQSSSTDSFDDLSKAELEKLERRVAEYLREEQDNPYDPSKPYKTPWRPRNYMAPFAFIPKYLEVNHNICAAVYLRHPVARVGSAEVPTPFPEPVNQLAFNWYLRRR
ncbi:alpha-L RNA-binding motif-containing protein [Daldinia vernicosa]|uniref:alpha-L RNA-binding motif-containing protein n=1 Tax=Daldinia vernicosa TaxID=114800 RepID=UPI00200755BA|nr:alpha-L RNA-binding motif-containing protein [Daldinia vernicosa]KAI0854312.1 alpha-L RNA-binding motif-containing protein [Daldinia vernicosa]